MTDKNINIVDSKWKGFKEAQVFKIIEESNNVKSFYLRMADGTALPSFVPGQFIAVKVKNEDGTYTKVRQYTLSKDYNSNYYRISIKREEEGYLSKILCDTIKENDIIEITAPMGNFVLKEGKHPLVLIGGGIGITPMITMAYDSKDADRDVYFIYSIPNSNCHCFIDEINNIAKENDRLNKTIVYTRPLSSNEIGRDFDFKGRINKEWMESHLPKDAEFYFCGPVSFMKSIYDNLIDLGIDEDRINYESFGPGMNFSK